MGGNSRAIDIETGEVLAYAQKVDLRDIDRRDFCNVVVKALRKLDELHAQTRGEPIWRSRNLTKLLDDGYAFNGSSAHLFGKSLSDEELIQHKPMFGDIDVTIPHNRLKSVFALLEGLRGLKWEKVSEEKWRLFNNFPIERFGYMGQNKPEQHGHQINALFAFRYGPKDANVLNVQVDFEGSEYEDGLPTDFSRFSHSSSWSDIVLGLKGVGHKYWITNLVRARSESKEIVLLTEKSPIPPAEYRLKKMDGELPRTHAFSVDRGLRKKVEVLKVKNAPIVIGGCFAAKEIPTSESKYVRDIGEIYHFLFKKKPKRGELEKMWSLSGLCDLCDETDVAPSIVDRAYTFLLQENLYGHGAQKLDRASAKCDEEAKDAITGYLRQRFQFLSHRDSEVKKMKDDFYARY